jgi:hypothetical protein
VEFSNSGFPRKTASASSRWRPRPTGDFPVRLTPVQAPRNPDPDPDLRVDARSGQGSLAFLLRGGQGCARGEAAAAGDGTDRQPARSPPAAAPAEGPSRAPSVPPGPGRPSPRRAPHRVGAAGHRRGGCTTARARRAAGCSGPWLGRAPCRPRAHREAAVPGPSSGGGNGGPRGGTSDVLVNRDSQKPRL